LPELTTVNIDTDPEWKKWYRAVENKTYVIRHDLDKWHTSGNSSSKCRLHTRIKHKFQTWKGAKCLIRHNPTQEELWVTVKVPDNYCECGKLIKVDKTYCMPCTVSKTKSSRPFYDTYQLREITVLTQDFEYVYRLFKYMDVKHKLVVHHLDCDINVTQRKRCEHVRSFIQHNQSALPKYSSRVRGNVTSVVKLIR